MIKVADLSRRYGTFTAVDHVSFTIEAGEVVGLLGHNGAGKTTIMKMMTGYLEPSSGSVEVGGIDVQAEPLAAQASIGYLPENPPIYPELTVTEYLAYAARLRQLDVAEVVPRAVEATRLQEKALDPIHTLSRGFKQRVGIAQAILHRPKYLILDEPTNGLDPSQIQQIRELIRELAHEATVILSTHIMQEVSAVCDRTLILRNARLVVDERIKALQQGSSVRLVTDPACRVDEVLGGERLGRLDSLGNGEWRFTNDDAAEDLTQHCARIARAAVAREVPIYSIGPVIRDLEAIFREVNEAEAPEVPEAQGGQHAA